MTTLGSDWDNAAASPSLANRGWKYICMHVHRLKISVDDVYYLSCFTAYLGRLPFHITTELTIPGGVEDLPKYLATA